MTRQQARPIWAARLGKMIQESFDLLGSVGKRHREGVAVRGIPVLDGQYRVVYRYGVVGDLLPDDIVEDFRDILGRARSVLDIAMASGVKAVANPPLNGAQSKKNYFPIAATEAGWNSMVGQPYMKALPQSTLTELRDIQPFVTGDTSVAEFAKVHNEDKHETPLQLAVIADPEFVMFFDHLVPRPRDTREYWLDWVDPLPPVQNRVVFAEYRSVDPIISAGVEDVPIALAVQVDGQWRDVQHLLWDVMEFVSRGSAILHDGDTALADSMKAVFSGERSQLAAFKKMILTGDPGAEAEWLRLAGLSEDEAAHPGHDDAV